MILTIEGAKLVNSYSLECYPTMDGVEEWNYLYILRHHFLGTFGFQFQREFDLEEYEYSQSIFGYSSADAAYSAAYSMYDAGLVRPEGR